MYSDGQGVTPRPSTSWITCPMTDRRTALTTVSGHPPAVTPGPAGPTPGAPAAPAAPGAPGAPAAPAQLGGPPGGLRVKREPACTGDMVHDNYSACYSCEDGDDINNNNNQPSSHNRNTGPLREFFFWFCLFYLFSALPLWLWWWFKRCSYK